MNLETPRPYASLDYTPEVERATARIHEKMRSVIPDLEWPVFAPYIAAINELKRQRNAVVLAHNYQTPEIFHGVADYVGDSLGLAQQGAKTDAEVIVLAGVHFMAETAKILSPEKTVLIPDPLAGCSLAASITGEDIRLLRQRYPGVPVVTYVNTSADVKAESDICCTSANAVAIVESLGVDRVIFLPDEFLGKWVATQTDVQLRKEGKIFRELVDLPILPEDVLCFIFAFLDAESLLLGVSLTCKRYHELVSSGRVYSLAPWIYKTDVLKNTKFRTEGRSFFDKKQWKESIESFTRAIILNPRDHLSYFWRAYAYDESGNYDLAVKDFSKSLEFEPQDATAYSNRGATYRDMGVPEKALRDLRKALEMDPHSAPVHNNVGVVLGDMGFYEEALMEYTKALEIDPNHVVALRNRGRRLEKLGRIKEAQFDFGRVLELNPKDVVALRFFETQKVPIPMPNPVPAC